MAEHIARLEAHNLEARPWQMGGEASSRMREENSLLQEDLTYDHVTCPAPDITEEVTFALEDIIRQRIVDKVLEENKMISTFKIVHFTLYFAGLYINMYMIYI